MTFANRQDVLKIEKEMPWEKRDLPKTVYQMLRETTQTFPKHPAVTYQLTSGPKDKAETLNWQEFHDQTCQAANLFRSLGVGEKDVVALLLPNAMETATATVAGMVAGIVNPINPLLEPDQIAAILRETKAKVLVTLKAFPKTDVPQKAALALKDAPNVKTVLEVDLLRYLKPPKKWIAGMIRPKNPIEHKAVVKDYLAECAQQNTVLDFKDAPKDRVAAYFHTGGTTGMPKVAQHKNNGIIYQGWLGHRLLFSENDSVMCPLPLFHVFACHVIMMAMIKSGAHVVFPTPQGYRGDGVFDNFWKLCERWKTTFIITVPTAVSQLMQRPVDADLSTVKKTFSGSAPMPLELFKRFEEAANITVIEGYGLTEATVLVSCNPPEGEKKVGSVGVPFPHTDVKIFKEGAKGPLACKADEIGEICIKGPGVYSGHTYTEAAKNKNLFYKKDYIRTGDLGRIDKDGYVWITGRAKDLIIRGGHNIDPAQIEEALATHPSVAMAGAIGQPDAHAGELPCAYVELVEGANTGPEELMDYALKHVSERAAQPKHVEIMTELPKTAVGKVFKPDLRKSAITRVYNEALEGAGIAARVVSVLDDKKRGLVAQLDQNSADQAAVKKILSPFTRPWEWIG